MTDFEHITTASAVKIYEAAIGVFSALLEEIREISKKKPDATLSGNKVKLINNVLRDLLSILENEPEGKYLQTLEDEALPQVSDALMMTVQFKADAIAFRSRYQQLIRRGPTGREPYWITEEILTLWDSENEMINDEDGSNIF